MTEVIMQIPNWYSNQKNSGFRVGTMAEMRTLSKTRNPDCHAYVHATLQGWRVGVGAGTERLGRRNGVCKRCIAGATGPSCILHPRRQSNR